MSKIAEPQPVKLFIGMLSQDVPLLETLQKELHEIFGEVDIESPVWPWEYSRYYEKEMGKCLRRKFIFFRELIHPHDIIDIKLKTNDIENKHLNEKGGRRINLDPGYLDSSKLVLVTAKNYSHRIYLDKGIYGEVTLRYVGNSYQAMPYTYRDYGSSEYIILFHKAREAYKVNFDSIG